MPNVITDLTGTTWTFNDNLTFLSADMSVSGYVTFELTSGGIHTYSFTQLIRGDASIRIISFDRYGIDSEDYIKSDRSMFITDSPSGHALTITFQSGTDATNATLISWLESNATQVLSGVSVEVNLKELNLSTGIHSFTAKAKVTGKADSASSSPAISYTVYSITNSITGGSASGDAKVSSTGSSTVTLTPTSGYNLPSTITVNGVTGSSGSTGCTWSYDSTTGIITLSQASANITISATCTQPQLNTPSMSLSGNTLTLTSSDDRGEYYDIYNNTTLLTSVSTTPAPSGYTVTIQFIDSQDIGGYVEVNGTQESIHGSQTRTWNNVTTFCAQGSLQTEWSNQTGDFVGVTGPSTITITQDSSATIEFWD